MYVCLCKCACKCVCTRTPHTFLSMVGTSFHRELSSFNSRTLFCAEGTEKSSLYVIYSWVCMSRLIPHRVLPVPSSSKSRATRAYPYQTVERNMNRRRSGDASWPSILIMNPIFSCFGREIVDSFSTQNGTGRWRGQRTERTNCESRTKQTQTITRFIISSQLPSPSRSFGP